MRLPPSLLPNRHLHSSAGMYSLSEGDSSYTLYFTTRKGIIYRIEFIEVDSLTFPGLPDPDRIVLLDLHPLVEPGERLPAEDQEIGETVFYAVSQVIRQNHIAVAYSCETTDKRQRVRARKFSQWFTRHNDGSLTKYDAEISAPHNQYCLSLLFSNEVASQSIEIDFITFIAGLQEVKE